MTRAFMHRNVGSRGSPLTHRRLQSLLSESDLAEAVVFVTRRHPTLGASPLHTRCAIRQASGFRSPFVVS